MALTHGQVLFVLARGREVSQELRETVKYLRRLGVPFSKKELGVGKGVSVKYRFDHLIELSIAMILRARGMELRDIALALKHLRSKLSPLYLQAHQGTKKGLGAPEYFRWDSMSKDDRAILLEGIYVDIGLYRRGETWVALRTEPMGPVEAVRALQTMGGERPYLGLIALSKVARDAVDLALQAPVIRRGRS